jgi:hypothetical protein
MRRRGAASVLTAALVLVVWLSGLPGSGAAALAAGPAAGVGHAGAATAPAAPPAGTYLLTPPGVPGGGPLSAAQQARLQRMAQAARLWQQQLQALADAARQQQDAALLAILARLDAQLRQIATAQATLAGLLAAQRAGQEALGLWADSAPSIDAAELPAWQEATTGADELTTAEETGFVFTADLSSGTTTSYVEGALQADPAAAPEASELSERSERSERSEPWEAAGGMDPADEPESRVEGGASPGGAPVPVAEAGGYGPSMESDLAAAGPQDGSARQAPLPAERPDGAAPPAGERAAEAATPNWIVIHGGQGGGESTGFDGPAAMPGEQPGADLDPVFQVQLDDAASGADAVSAEEADAELETAAGTATGPFPGLRLQQELICRPWQPAPSAGGLCALPGGPLG